MFLVFDREHERVIKILSDAIKADLVIAADLFCFGSVPKDSEKVGKMYLSLNSVKIPWFL